MPGERVIGPSFDPDGPGYEVGRCTCDPGPEGQHQWYCGHDPERCSVIVIKDRAVTFPLDVVAPRG